MDTSTGIDTGRDGLYNCPPGSYNDREGAYKEEHCLPVPPGFYEDTYEAIIVNTANLC